MLVISMFAKSFLIFTKAGNPMQQQSDYFCLYYLSLCLYIISGSRSIVTLLLPHTHTYIHIHSHIYITITIKSHIVVSYLYSNFFICLLYAKLHWGLLCIWTCNILTVLLTPFPLLTGQLSVCLMFSWYVILLWCIL